MNWQGCWPRRSTTKVCKYAAPDMAELYVPLVMKSALRIVEQLLQWTSGVLFEAYKHSGFQAAMESYRSLCVASIPGKLYHRVLRQKFARSANHHLGGLHCGAKEGCSVTTPSSLALHLMTRLAKDGSLSAATIFLDTKTAYYAVARELAMGPIQDDCYTAAVHLLALVKSMYKGGWFVTGFAGGQEVCVTTKGSRPGSCWADPVFTFIYARVLAKVRQVAECEDFGFKVKWTGVQNHGPKSAIVCRNSCVWTLLGQMTLLQ